VKFDKSNPIHLLLSLLMLFVLIVVGVRATGSISKVQLGVGLSGTCSLDNLGGATKEAPNQYSVSSLTSSVTFQGWIANVPTGESPAKLKISLADEKNYVKWSKDFKTDFPRPDVVAAYGTGNEMLNSGFNAAADLVKLSPGTYSILLQGEYSGNQVLCSGLNTLVIRD
jgi:hypothetical protein